MLSNFHTWSETEKKLFVAKIIHEINYSQSKLDLMENILKAWEKHPNRRAYYYTTQNTIQYGQPTN